MDQRKDEIKSDGHVFAKSENVCSVVMETLGGFSANLVIPFFLIIKGRLLTTLLSCRLHYQRRLTAEIVSYARA